MSKLTDSIAQLATELVTPHAPTEKWTGQACGMIDMYIDEQGRWFHQGGQIKRLGLLKLFASVLSCEQNRHWLTTPIERCEMRVIDVAFLIDSWYSQFVAGEKVLVAVDNLGRNWPIYKQFPLKLRRFHDVELPYLSLGNGLQARISRNVYYQWVEELAEQDEQGVYICSAGMKFYLT
ncbi:hypothetical protein PSECIP111951_02785 [Pseudoalteromonas holothuriae]|uniref:DUF1285 domain-containing protein n=1 Tax=Pseudoalteromonas holothuriae TaxID=2963714 RepID=A0A9W4VPE4_9GAMM|nr:MULTISPECIES: DUF1285 domain-containing protein [unclassified Pseudoalteromonas]CAH9055349.1 hypothetical protein PSECIP111854_01563 [Pseudoalteromonas sp. CIP111854]CAH9062851.1 hypothetical protein PSECIP111951_02785 [Pseudoalteromonas sp. CIP111951]